MANPLSVAQIRAMPPGSLVTISPGRGGFNRSAFVARVESVAPDPSLAVYLRTPSSKKQLRLSPVRPHPACDDFRLSPGAGEWQVTLGYDKEFLGPEPVLR